MKRNIYITCLLLTAATLHACSYKTTFAVSNSSNESITIEYYVRSGWFSEPKILDVDNYKRGKYQLDKLAVAEYTSKEDKRHIALALPSGKAVILESLVNYREHNESDRRKFMISTLTITSKDGQIHYDGIEAVKAFKKLNKSHYLLEYM